MCGIAGFLLSDTSAPDNPQAVLHNMGMAILHRGPDGDGCFWDASAGLGLSHRRLSIQDLSEHGAQPMHSASGRFTIVFNGEIYNFRKLRSELDGLGHTFRGGSDTEVMLAAFEAWGVEDGLKRLAGMFAFALLDRETEHLWLARDRMGEKPLYYGWFGETLLFGSELKALRAFPGFNPAVNRDALTLLLRHNYIPAPHSIYQGIYKLPQAHYLRINLGQSAQDDEPKPYWSLQDAFLAAPGYGNAREASDALEGLLGDIIQEQMVADVPLGAFLSGGIDSSTVVALMQQRASQPVRTFTIGFEEEGFNEAEHASAVAAHLGTRHTELYVSPGDALEVIPDLPRIYDEPFADSSQIPTYLVSRMTREHVTVSLSGDGGDELFAGYDRYPKALRDWKRLHRTPSSRQRLERGILGLPDRLAAPAVRLLNREQRHAAAAVVREKVLRERSLRRRDELASFYQQRVGYWSHPELLVQHAREPLYALNMPLPAPLQGLSPIKQLQWLDINSYLPDDILVKVDRAAMAVSLETRVPMLDHRFVEFALSLPAEWSLSGDTGKQLLRDVLYRHVPRELVDRPKQGFAVPVAHWLRDELRDWAESLLDASRLDREGYWNTRIVRAFWEDHIEGRADHSFYLWSILTFQAWLEHQQAQANAVLRSA